MAKTERLEHPFPPLWDASSEILILGSFPSVKSREQQFFYGHPQNRFWKVIAALTGRPAVKLPSTSPANAACNLEKLCAQWGVIFHT